MSFADQLGLITTLISVVGYVSFIRAFNRRDRV